MNGTSGREEFNFRLRPAGPTGCLPGCLGGLVGAGLFAGGLSYWYYCNPIHASGEWGGIGEGYDRLNTLIIGTLLVGVAGGLIGYLLGQLYADENRLPDEHTALPAPHDSERVKAPPSPPHPGSAAQIPPPPPD